LKHNGVITVRGTAGGTANGRGKLRGTGAVAARYQKMSLSTAVAAGETVREIGIRKVGRK